MAWALLDDNFPNHPKVVQAGPVAAYLFVCGLCYCRKFHTEGFIPSNAIKTLGVSTNPRRLVDALIVAGLWERTEAGVRVHDYVSMYPDDSGDKARKEEVSRKRREAGRRGGLSTQAKLKQTDSKSEAIASLVAGSSAKAHRVGIGSAPGSQVLETEKGDPPFDEWFERLRDDYPQSAVSAGHLTQQAFFNALSGHREGSWFAWSLMQANLENQKRGYQWRVKRMIPKLEKWLREGLWLQQHEESAPVAERLTSRTNTTLEAAAEVMREAK